jgi:hypothetical protein
MYETLRGWCHWRGHCKGVEAPRSQGRTVGPRMLLAHYRTSTLDLLIDALTETAPHRRFVHWVQKLKCRNLEDIQLQPKSSTKWEEVGRYRCCCTASWVMESRCDSRSQNNWYFREIVFVKDGDYVNDPMDSTMPLGNHTENFVDFRQSEFVILGLWINVCRSN